MIAVAIILVVVIVVVRMRLSLIRQAAKAADYADAVAPVAAEVVQQTVETIRTEVPIQVERVKTAAKAGVDAAKSEWAMSREDVAPQAKAFAQRLRGRLIKPGSQHEDADLLEIESGLQ